MTTTKAKKPEVERKPRKKPDYEVVDHVEFGLILVANNDAPLRNARTLGGRLPNSLRYVPLPALPHPVVGTDGQDVTVTLLLADSSWHRMVVR